ncbi:hypothetical protein AMATHDRAFT_190088 [Amanita thiersii Skay4041]|uniref:Arrestin C-terminal-like domain-containing protein n=1 Tax=Amanita thiersii Skay4041 TaxID=703135 RepID=A0A2A9NPV2_9AGAR|nr:hypothetical protein AMATHDRAFT_190088 [Amanita thiersii Skay4041]
MPPSEKPKKNSLSIRLTESAVFLRTRPGRRSTHDSQPSVLRGLLVFDLAKPTKISSIELELQAKSSSAWPEGFGARRVDITEEHTVFQASTVYFRAGKTQARRTTSIGPGIAPDELEASLEDWDASHPHTPRFLHDVSQPPTRPSSRRGSIDHSDLHLDPVDHHEDHHLHHLGRIPPYSLYAPGSPLASVSPSPASSMHHLPLVGTHVDIHTPPTSPTSRRSRASLALLSPAATISESNDYLSHGYFRHEHDAEMHDEAHHGDLSRHSTPLSPSPSQRPDSSRERRGRSGTRFSLASMSNALMHAMRPGTPLTPRHSTEDARISQRGRTLEKSSATMQDPTSHERGHSKERSTLNKFSEILRGDHDHKDSGSNWKEFKKGTYTYPISISIPGHCPPTMRCEYGSVSWRLRAVVHRPGTFRPRFTAAREVIIVACPIEDDIEDTENIIVERHWDQQLQYLVSVSGRSFYIGGAIPFSITLMPLAKVHVHRIVVYIEERVDYYTKMARPGHIDPIKRFELLSVKNSTKEDDPILPLETDDVDALKNSPLYTLCPVDGDLSEMASNLMGPGPWSFNKDLQLPKSCSQIHFTNKNKKSNIVINHTLKCVIRVSHGDDRYINPKTGKRKLFDIVIHTPVHILSSSFVQCRCNPDWSALPGYTERFTTSGSTRSTCPCEAKRLANGHDTPFMFRRSVMLERNATRHSSDSGASTAETSSVNHNTMRSLQDTISILEANTQYEQLVSGQVTETGESPPAYDEVS